MEALETQAQATQEKENAVTKQNMKYTMSLQEEFIYRG